MYYIIPKNENFLSYAMDMAKKINGKYRVIIDTDFNNTYENRAKNAKDFKIIFIESESYKIGNMD
jgi:hypothetical protein